jgi:hypothetical protein
MNKVKKFHFFLLLLMSPVLFLQNTGCQKEYSFEGAGSTGYIQDTLGAMGGPVAGEFTKCNLCDPSAELAIGEWSFRTGNSFLCGGVTNSGFFNGYSRKDITFFGPSACSVDTGIVLSIYNLASPLNGNQSNISCDQVTFYYYDHNASKDILSSSLDKPFTATIITYVNSTQIATGTFSGTVLKANGDTAIIKDGKFKVLIK